MLLVFPSWSYSDRLSHFRELLSERGSGLPEAWITKQIQQQQKKSHNPDIRHASLLYS